MKPKHWAIAAAGAMLLAAWTPTLGAQPTPEADRVVILKVDGLNADLLFRTMAKIDPDSRKSRLPWFSHIFGENGVIFDNFYTRGISLSAPSWSMLDTGRHGIIRGNVEYDRYTGQIYDYLNFFPFYIGYARKKEVDMPGVEVLDEAGVPLLLDQFKYENRFQSFQTFQRGVRWTTLKEVLKRRFSSRSIVAMLENGEAPSFDRLYGDQMESELKRALAQPGIFYLDYFTSDIDHQAHETSQAAALEAGLRRLDGLAGRVWTAIQASPMARRTLFVVVSDHGMNNVPGVVSQTFSLPDLLNSPEGGGHHVLTNRHQLSDYKLRGLDPLVHKVITPSGTSFYLAGQASRYPTAWLDIDGNERVAVHLRNNDLNRIHILLQQLARPELTTELRRAAATYLGEIVEARRAEWTARADELDEEMKALGQAIEERKRKVQAEPKRWTAAERARGEDKVVLRERDELSEWQLQRQDYTAYATHLRALLKFRPDGEKVFTGRIAELVPELTLGDNNTAADLQHYVVGANPAGLQLDAQGRVDEEASFRHVDYFSLLAAQRVRNNPQPALGDRPIDFTMMAMDGALPGEDGGHVFWLYGDEAKQLLVETRGDGAIRLEPVIGVTQARGKPVECRAAPWQPELPLHLFEDPELQIPAGVERGAWLSEWHTEREWLRAIHRTRYSDGVIGVVEDLSPVGENVPGEPGISAAMLRFERLRRELVQADFHVFAADHWNFNVRFPNAGGNHGSFLRISTHSVWMMAGGGLRPQKVEEPYDTLSFASTVLSLLGHTAPMPDRVLLLH